MSSAAAALLDQLMGKHRNATAGEETKREHWSDPEVCKYFLCGFCPSELFTNTRSDIGPCEKNHDETLQIAYTASSKFGRMGYEEDFLECLERVVRDLDKRIQRGKERLARSAEANKRAFSDESGNMFSERLQSLSAEISDLIHQSEELGNRGDVEAAQELILRVEELEKEKERERSAMMLKANVPQTVAGFEIDPGNFHEKNEICDVCGCFLIIGDTQARMDAHLMGKQHMGFARIRSKIAELKQAREDKLVKEAEERRTRRESRSTRDEPKESRDRRVSVGHRSRSRDREKRRSRSRDRERRRRSRSREKKRSRSRDRRYRSRSGDRRRRSRERRRSHSKERRRSRSRDSKRRRRSRSRSHERSKHRDKKRERSDRGKHRSRSRSKDRKEDGTNSKNHDAPSEEAMENSSTNEEGAGLGQENHIMEGPETANGIDAD